MPSFMEVVNVMYHVLENVVNCIYERLNGVSERVGVIEGQAEGVSVRVDGVCGRVDDVMKDVNGLIGRIDGVSVRVTSAVKCLTDRMGGVEKSVTDMTEIIDI